MTKPGPNDPCPCGSGKKTKKCCGGATAARPGPRPVPWQDPVDRLSNRVPALVREGRLDEAEAVARQLLEQHPDEPDGLERTAEVLEVRGDRQGAAAWYRRASRHHLERDPDYGAEPAAYYAALADRLDAGGEGAPEAHERP
jgi:DNA-binding SARP family transcriptional activator